MSTFLPTLDEKVFELARSKCSHKALSERERALTALTASFMLEDVDQIREQVGQARHCGVSDEDISHVCSIVLAMRGWKIEELARLAREQQATPKSSCSQTTTCI